MRVLYLSYTGLMEPLGQSQILAYLSGLSANHRITLITFEKRDDLNNTAEKERLRALCRDAAIEWRPMTYHLNPRLLATAWDLLGLFFAVLGQVIARRPDLIHCRSYIPAFVATIVRKLGGPPFIFDTRALWLDEMIEAQRLGKGSRLHRMLAWAERASLRSASGIVSLTNIAIPHFRKLADAGPDDARFVMIPTCVDVSRFARVARTRSDDEPITVGCLGTVMSGWFKLDWLIACFEAVDRADPDARYLIVTRDHPGEVRSAMGGFADRAGDRLAVESATPPEVPATIAGFTISPFFYATGLARLAGCPTRMGELLAAGIPVLANRGSGDVDEIIDRYRVGVLVDGPEPQQMADALDRSRALLADPGLPQRCRRAADEWFSVSVGIERYDRLYRAIGNAEAA